MRFLISGVCQQLTALHSCRGWKWEQLTLMLCVEVQGQILAVFFPPMQPLPGLDCHRDLKMGT